MPPMNRPVIDTLAATPKMMKAMEGGITGAIHAAGSHQAGGARHVVAGLAHHRDEDGGQCGRIGRRRTRQGGHDDGRHDRDDAQPAGDVADAGDREFDDAFRQATGIHQFAGQEEERDGRSVKVLAPVTICLADDLRVEDAHPGHQHDAAEHQREGDRNPHRQSCETSAEKDAEDQPPPCRSPRASHTEAQVVSRRLNWAMPSRDPPPRGLGKNAPQEAKKRDRRPMAAPVKIR